MELFRGSVRDVAAVFPVNVNTMATAALAAAHGLGFDGTTAAIVADGNDASHDDGRDDGHHDGHETTNAVATTSFLSTTAFFGVGPRSGSRSRPLSWALCQPYGQ